jgi:hypothetical protein
VGGHRDGAHRRHWCSIRYKCWLTVGAARRLTRACSRWTAQSRALLGH